MHRSFNEAILFENTYLRRLFYARTEGLSHDLFGFLCITFIYLCIISETFLVKFSCSVSIPKMWRSILKINSSF